MSLENAVLFKVYLVLPGEEETQIRKFSIDRDAVTNFLYVKQKISSLFPLMQNLELDIFWTDEDNDSIQICNDEELLIALTELQGVYKKLIIKPSNHQKPLLDVFSQKGNEGKHDGVVCDACNKNVNGFRYKCVICPDYDLCSECENKQMHKEHMMFRLPFPIKITPFSQHRLNKEINKFGKAFEKLAHGVRNWSQYGRAHHHRHSKGPFTEPREFSENQQKEETPEEPAINLPVLLNLLFGKDNDILNKLEELYNFAKKAEVNPSEKEHRNAATTNMESEQTTPETNNEQLINKNASTSNAKTSMPCDMETEDGWALIKKECKVDDALKTMLAMGFNNEGGWLRDMLIQTEGDIRKVIDKMIANKIF